jgi:hypothetical protein
MSRILTHSEAQKRVAVGSLIKKALIPLNDLKSQHDVQFFVYVGRPDPGSTSKLLYSEAFTEYVQTVLLEVGLDGAVDAFKTAFLSAQRSPNTLADPRSLPLASVIEPLVQFLKLVQAGPFHFPYGAANAHTNFKAEHQWYPLAHYGDPTDATMYPMDVLLQFLDAVCLHYKGHSSKFLAAMSSMHLRTRDYLCMYFYVRNVCLGGTQTGKHIYVWLSTSMTF